MPDVPGTAVRGGSTKKRRGRLPTHEYTRLRDRIDAIKAHDEDFSRELIRMVRSREIRATKAQELMEEHHENSPLKMALEALLAHRRSWDMEPTGRSADAFRSDRVMEPWRQWEPGKFEDRVGKDPEQFLEICAAHERFPDSIATRKRCVCTKEFGIFLVLRRPAPRTRYVAT